MNIRLVACDLDGTLMGQDLVFSTYLLSILRRVREQGVIVTIATGRGYPSTRHFARQLGVTAPLICYQGAQIRTADGDTVYSGTFPPEHLSEVIAFCHAGGWELAVYCDDEIYQSTLMYEQAYYDRWFGLPIHLAPDLLAAIPGEPVKFIAIAPDASSADRLEREMAYLAKGKYKVVRSHPWFVEGMALDVSKGESLARLAGHMGIAREETMALGDSDNDISMVRWAGLGVAMGDASPALKQAAAVIAPAQSEDGAAWALARYALGETE
jgi:Cof subfamily protein (haloacid dehalogenase superfamily)